VGTGNKFIHENKGARHWDEGRLRRQQCTTRRRVTVKAHGGCHYSSPKGGGKGEIDDKPVSVCRKVDREEFREWI